MLKPLVTPVDLYCAYVLIVLFLLIKQHNSVGGIMVDRSDNSVRKIRLFKIGYILLGQTN